jgi:DNA replicative helicase MCM subunit Mcm2 (Cdc46/Mcm family)
MDIDLLKHYNDEAELCLDIFEELKESDPDLAEEYYNKAGQLIDNTHDVINEMLREYKPENLSELLGWVNQKVVLAYRIRDKDPNLSMQLLEEAKEDLETFRDIN